MACDNNSKQPTSHPYVVDTDKHSMLARQHHWILPREAVVCIAYKSQIEVQQISTSRQSTVSSRLSHSVAAAQLTH
eukprot:14439-Heterococcus_DN1.PRE.1